jgi:hypothetical protein
MEASKQRRNGVLAVRVSTIRQGIEYLTFPGELSVCLQDFS